MSYGWVRRERERWGRGRGREGERERESCTASAIGSWAQTTGKQLLVEIIWLVMWLLSAKIFKTLHIHYTIDNSLLSQNWDISDELDHI